MLLQAALNGGRTKAAHGSVPVTMDELARDAADCVAAGAGLIHLHPRGPDGRECIAADVVNAVVAHVRAACGVPVGVSTAAWIEPDVRRRLERLRAWHAPDYASVNLREDGALAVVRVLLEAGIGVEAGIWTPADATALVESGVADAVTRVLVELIPEVAGETAQPALAMAAEIHAILDRGGVRVPRLQHGEGRLAWPALADAAARGLGTRIGFEDTMCDPHGSTVGANAELVRAARALGAAGATALPAGG